VIAIALFWAGVAAAGVGALGLVRGLGGRWTNGWFAVANALLLVSRALDDYRLAACMHAALGAGAAWLWWHDGGGDGTKRRLKSWARKFRGVRRTAPVAGAA
jgi:hypothetical protein